MKYVVATYLARFVGIFILVPALFPSLFIARFPGLMAPSVRGVLFGVGVVIYIGASVVYYILRKKERERRNADS